LLPLPGVGTFERKEAREAGVEAEEIRAKRVFTFDGERAAPCTAASGSGEQWRRGLLDAAAGWGRGCRNQRERWEPAQGANGQELETRGCPDVPQSPGHLIDRPRPPIVDQNRNPSLQLHPLVDANDGPRLNLRHAFGVVRRIPAQDTGRVPLSKDAGMANLYAGREILPDEKPPYSERGSRHTASGGLSLSFPGAGKDNYPYQYVRFS